jgi:hypothetical protein
VQVGLSAVEEVLDAEIVDDNDAEEDVEELVELEEADVLNPELDDDDDSGAVL